MKHEILKGIPETDEEAYGMLARSHSPTTIAASTGIYKIFREQGQDVPTAYMATLDHVIAVMEKRKGK